MPALALPVIAAEPDPIFAATVALDTVCHGENTCVDDANRADNVSVGTRSSDEIAEDVPSQCVNQSVTVH
jgi:hypothetical protein